MADRGPAVFAVSTATLVLASVFVLARVVSRVFIVRQVSWDDYFIVVAALIAVALTTTIDLGTRQGLGRRDVDIEPGDLPGLRRCEYAFSVLYVSPSYSLSLSLSLFFSPSLVFFPFLFSCPPTSPVSSPALEYGPSKHLIFGTVYLYGSIA
jgi:hypothetical protein